MKIMWYSGTRNPNLVTSREYMVRREDTETASVGRLDGKVFTNLVLECGLLGKFGLDSGV